MSGGLPAEVEILCGERLLIEKLNYLRVPFRCSVCHKTGHLRHQCPSLRTFIEYSGSDIFQSDVACNDNSSPLPLGTHVASPFPTELVSDSFLNDVDGLIMSHSIGSRPMLYDTGLSHPTPMLADSPAATDHRASSSLLPHSPHVDVDLSNSSQPLLIVPKTVGSLTPSPVNDASTDVSDH